jgi:hypothetical protein
MPALWQKIMDYTKGGDRPSYAEAQAAFDEYLDNIRFENCDWVKNVIPSIFRRPGCSFRACDYSTANDGIRWVDKDGETIYEWEKTLTEFTGGGAAEYRLYSDGEPGVIEFTSDFENATVEISADGETLLRTTLSGRRDIAVRLNGGHDCTLGISCVKGSFTLDTIAWKKA